MTAPEQGLQAPMDRPVVWAVGGCAVVVLLVALSWFGPLVPIAALALAAAVVITIVCPQLLVALVVAVIVFSTPLQAVLGGTASRLDDGLVAFSAVALPVRRLLTERRLVWLPGSAWFAGFLTLGLVSGVAREVPDGLLVSAAFVAVKGLVLAFAVAQVPWTLEHLRIIASATGWIIVLVVAAGLVNLVSPVSWSGLLGTRYATGPLGIPALTGFFSRPGAFSRFCGVLAIAALAYHYTVRRSAFAVAAFASCAALAFLTLQVKTVLGLLATVIVISVPFLRRARIGVVVSFVPLVALAVAPPLFLLVATDVDSYVLQDSARSLLAQGGAQVANTTFPFGAGFGRFGSSTAADSYSPWYYELGFDRRFGMGPAADSGQFLNDSQWPAIYGEAGWIGAACFAIGVGCMFVHLLRGVRREPVPLVRWIRLAGIGWMLLLLAESAAAPVFVSSPAYPFVFIASAVVASMAAAPRNAADRHLSVTATTDRS